MKLELCPVEDANPGVDLILHGKQVIQRNLVLNHIYVTVAGDSVRCDHDQVNRAFVL